MVSEQILWGVFAITILFMLALDLGVFHRESHEIKMKEALIWSAVWIILSLLFNVLVTFVLGSEKGLEFLTGYVIEKSLSVDNLFVFVVLFKHFKVVPAYQHRVLFWGILFALVIRALFIGTGIALLAKFHWIIYFFGFFLIYTGIKMVLEHDSEHNPEDNPLLGWLRKKLPLTESYEEDRFFVKREGKWLATPLFIVLIIIETTDVVFAVDSVPAILAISADPFIVFTSNVFAILGLRALYFALAGLIPMFYYLQYALSLILVFVGLKMLVADMVPIPIAGSLLFILGILLTAIAASLIRSRKSEAPIGILPPGKEEAP